MTLPLVCHILIDTYAEAGVKTCEEIGMAELYDCLGITKLVTYEDLRFSPVGKTAEDYRGRGEIGIISKIEDGEQ